MKLFQAILGSCLLVIDSGGAMADPDIPREDAEILKERIKAHRAVYQGFAMPEIHVNYLLARWVGDRLRKGGPVDGLSPEAESHLRRHLVDEFDRRAIAQSAMEAPRRELMERLVSGDTDTYGLAVIFNQFRDAEQRAVSDIYKMVMRELDAKDRQVAEALVESRIASTVKVVVDFAALSLEEPDYVLRHLESFRRAYSDRPGRGGPAVPNSPGDVLGDDDVIEVFFE